METADHRLCLFLELLSGLSITPRSDWTFEEWAAKLRRIPAREARVVVLHIIHGMPFPAIGERLGVSRGRTDQLWRAAIRRLSLQLQEAA